MENKDKLHVKSISNLESLEKEELIEHVIRLEKHIAQLKNLNKKLQQGEVDKKVKPGRPFDFSKTTKRHILLRFYYLGWDYQGYAAQEDSMETIEHHLINALIRVCLIKDRESANYQRCGRTDKGVSAFHQVISIDVRSKLSDDQIKNMENLDQEINYCALLNRVLPKDIRCISWMPLKNKFYSSRFDCKERTYRYFFPRGNLDINLMQESGQAFVGSHDFRNFCKMDIQNGVTMFVRKILQVKIVPMECEASPYQMHYIEIVGQAFLYHQIRNIMAVLFLIGQKLEKPEVIIDLLDVQKNPCKPNYHLAHYVPLNLYHVEYKEISGETGNGIQVSQAMDIDRISDLTTWIYDESNLQEVIETLQGHWCIETVKSSMMKSMLNDLEELYKTKFPNSRVVEDQIFVLRDEKKSKSYKPLMQRQKASSLEERLTSMESKKRKLSEM
uniref:CSON015595 protein n=1 Tax=Culicoides sonorensis TaxID=179676 RepID=A0A336K3G1_CULSO